MPFARLVLIFLALSSRLPPAQESQPERLFREAVDAQQRGDFAAAIREYRELLKLQPDSLGARANLGAALAHVDRFDEAISEYRAALKLDPGSAAIRLNLALAFYKKGDYQNAAGQFRDLLKTDPSKPRVVTLLGECEIHLGHAGEAARLTAPMAESQPDNLDLAYVAGTALIQSGKPRNGLVFIERVAKNGQSADAYLLAGSTWLDLNELEAARKDLEIAEQLRPDLPGVHTMLGMALDKSSDPKAAEPELRRGLEANPDDFEANLYMGAILYKRRDITSARGFLQHALRLDPASAMAHYEFGLVESASGQYDAAAADLHAALKQDPNWLEPHVELAALYYKMHDPADGAKEREIVDRLTAEQQKRGPQ